MTSLESKTRDIVSRTPLTADAVVAELIRARAQEARHRDGVAPVVTRIISEAQTNLEVEIVRLTAWNQQQAQEACDYMARIQKLTAEVDRLRARESALLEANNLEEVL